MTTHNPGRERAVVVGWARTPFGRFGGALANVDQRDLGAFALRACLGRIGHPDVDQVLMGVNFPGSNRSIARQAALRAGLPETVDAITVDRACCSSLAAVRYAIHSLGSGDCRLAVAGGTENLSKVPYFLEDLRFGRRLGPVELKDQLLVSCPHSGVPRAVQAAEEAAQYGIGRAEQDAWAQRSHERYWMALERGFFTEIAAVEGQSLPGAEDIDADESPRRSVTAAALERLATVNGSTTVTAGNAPGLSTGATAVALTTRQHARQHALPVRASVVGLGWASGQPQAIGATPAVAARRALASAGLDLNDIHHIEINEAFAAVPLVTTHVLAEGDTALLKRLRARTNPNGGAVAIGHPTGASGARLLMTTVAALHERGGGTGLVTICGGVAEAESIVVRVEQGAET